MAKTKKTVEKTVAVAKEVASQVKDTAKKASAAVMEQVEKEPAAAEAVKEMKETVDTVAKQAKKASKKVSDAVKETVEKNPAVAEAVKGVKETVEKVADETKTTAKQTAKKAKAKIVKPVVKEVYLQYQGREIRQSDVTEMVIASYMAQGHEREDIKQIELYVKPEDCAVYYVINSEETGKVTF